MGITTNDFFENIYSVIFSPKAFFESKEIKISLRLAIATIVSVVTFSNITTSVFDGSVLTFSFVTSLIFNVVVSVVVWFLTALFFEYTAKIFSYDGNLNKILFYTAFAPVPYIFFAPLNLIKQVNVLGYITGALVEFVLYIWIISLYAYSVKSAYNISFARAFMLILLPFVSAFFVIYWGICFCLKMGYIFSV